MLESQLSLKKLVSSPHGQEGKHEDEIGNLWIKTQASEKAQMFYFN